MSKVVVPYKMGSISAEQLAQALGATIRPRNRPVLYGDELIINWGCGEMQVRGNNVLNKPQAVALASNKLRCLQILQENNIPCPVFTSNIEKASEWANKGAVVYARQKLQGSGGEGIVVMKRGTPVANASLYTLGVQDAKEYRVHVVKDRVIDVVEKRRRSGVETTDEYIKNLAGGWVYCRDNVNTPTNVKKAAIDAIKVLGLDFGAVDVLYREGKPIVLEVNTAPGLEGSTFTSYVEAFNELFLFDELDEELEETTSHDEDDSFSTWF